MEPPHDERSTLLQANCFDQFLQASMLEDPRWNIDTGYSDQADYMRDLNLATALKTDHAAEFSSKQIL